MNHAALIRQRGVASLVTTIALVLIASIGIFYLSRNVIIETRTIGNSLAAQRALLNAEGRLATELHDFRSSNQPLTTYFSGRPNIKLCLADPSPPAHPNRTLYHASDPVLCPPPQNGRPALVIARGTDTIDSEAERYVSMVLNPPGGLGSNAIAPMVVQGATGTIAGNAAVYNNDSNLTIWTGRRLDEITGSFSTFIQINGQNNQKSSEKVGNTYTIGPDVVLNDYNLRNLSATGLDRLALGMTREEFRATADMTIDLKTESLSKLTSANPKPRTVYIYNSTPNATVNVTLNTSLGSANEPIVVVVNGNINFTGSPTIYGRIYATGNLDFQGNGSIYGSVISGGMSGASAGGGNFNIFANAQVTTKVEEILNPASYRSATWRDW